MPFDDWGFNPPEPPPALTNITPQALWPGDESPVVKALRTAQEIIASPALWGQGQMYISPPWYAPWAKTRYCAQGAVHVAVWQDPNAQVLRKYCFSALRSALDYRGFPLHMMIGDFNDLPSTTHHDIMSLFAEAIEIARLDWHRGASPELATLSTL